MRTIKTLLVALVALTAISPAARRRAACRSRSSSGTSRRFARQSGIPGLSAAIIQNGRVVWDKGLGYQDVENSIAATAETPYPVFDLTQALSSTVVLQQCLEQRYLELTDRV